MRSNGWRSHHVAGAILVSLAIALAGLFVARGLASAIAVVDQLQTTTGSSTSVPPINKLAQVITAGTGGPLVQANVYIQRFAPTGQDLTLQVQGVIGGQPDGIALA